MKYNQLYLLICLIHLVIFNKVTNCSEVEDKEEEVEKKVENNEDQMFEDMGLKFLSSLNHDLRQKVMKNQELMDGSLDENTLDKDNFTKAEIDEIQKALAEAMQPLFGKLAAELGNKFGSKITVPTNMKLEGNDTNQDKVVVDDDSEKKGENKNDDNIRKVKDKNDYDDDSENEKTVKMEDKPKQKDDEKRKEDDESKIKTEKKKKESSEKSKKKAENKKKAKKEKEEL